MKVKVKDASCRIIYQLIYIYIYILLSISIKYQISIYLSISLIDYSLFSYNNRIMKNNHSVYTVNL